MWWLIGAINCAATPFRQIMFTRWRLGRCQKGLSSLNTQTTFRLAPWQRPVALSFLLGFALLVGNLLSLGTAHAQAALTCPKITSFSPTSGSAGVSVTITGCGFTGATKVTFKGVSAIFTVTSDTQITATVPSGAATGRIAVTTSSGATVQSSSKFAVLKAPPAVTLSPSAGPPTSSVSVSGSNFGSYEAVDIYFDTTDEALAATNAQGAFSGTSILVPASALPGTHWITAVGRHSGLSAQTAFTVQTNWVEFGDLPQHTRANQYENVLSPANVGSLDVDWSAATGAGIFSSPAVVNGVVYVGSNDVNLYAFNAQTGAQLWAAATGNVVDSSPAVANGVVYVGSEDHHLYAYTLPGNEQFRPAGRPNPANLHPNLKLHL
jgi:outer membrane protein assembly factor BamB